MAWYRCVGGAGGSLKLRTASGRIATFSTNMAEAFKSLKSDINPVQDLHGYSKPWSGGGGKNKFNFEGWLQANNITYTKSGYSYTFNITRNALYNNPFVFDSSNINLAFNSTITIPSGSGANNVGFELINSNNQIVGSRGSQVSGSACKVRLNWSSAGIVTITEPIAVFDSTIPTFEPYENICPISGFSALNVTRTGKNLFDIEKWLTDNNVTFSKVGDYYKFTVTNVLFSNFFEFPASIKTLTFDINQSETTATTFRIKAKLQNGTITNIYPQQLPYTSNIIGVAFNWSTVGTLCIKAQVELGSTATDYEAYNGQTASVNFGQTVYGGVADVTNGKVNVAYAKKKINELTWNYVNISGAERFYSSSLYQEIERPASLDTVSTLKCSCYKTVSQRQYAQFTDNNIIAVQVQGDIVIRDTNYTSVSDLLNAVGEQEICYPLATPIEIDTTPENLTAIVGQNNVYSDTNGDTTVKYLYRE